jgi:hypothetical protein
MEFSGEDPGFGEDPGDYGDGFRMPKRPLRGQAGPDRHRRPRGKSHPSRPPQNSLKISLSTIQLGMVVTTYPKKRVGCRFHALSAAGYAVVVGWVGLKRGK